MSLVSLNPAVPLARQRDLDAALNSPAQRFAHLLHFLKARFSRKERARAEWLAHWIPDGGVIFDVGAHFGYLSKEFALLHGGRCVIHAFEPVTYTSGILEKVVRRFGNVTIHRFGLSTAEGTHSIQIPIKSSGKLGPGLAHMGPELNLDFVVQPIALKTIDSFVSEQNLRSVEFIKCDVEGAELLVFQGGSNTIGRFHPTVYCEVNDRFTQRVGYRAQAIFDFFIAQGYGAWRVGDRGTPVAVTTYGESDDYLFLHPSRALAS